MIPSALQFREVWVHSPKGNALCGLINGDVACLIMIPANGNGGFTSRNPDYHEPANQMVEYRLNNGQVDEYPRSWAYPTSIVEAALEHFRREEELPPFVVWRDDANDPQGYPQGYPQG